MSLRILASRSLSRAAVPGVRAMSTTGDYMRSKDNYEAVLDKFAEIRACAVLRTPTSEACPKAMVRDKDKVFGSCDNENVAAFLCGISVAIMTCFHFSPYCLCQFSCVVASSNRRWIQDCGIYFDDS